MLQNIRERMQGIIAWIIVLLICVTFALWGINYYLQSGQDNSVAATVDGVKITKQQVGQLYQRLLHQQQVQLGAKWVPSVANQKALEEAALNQLIESVVLTKGAQANGFRISQAQVSAVIENMPQFQQNDQFSQVRFKQFLYALGYTAQNLYQELMNSMMIQQVQLTIVHSEFALPDEVAKNIALVAEKRDFSYVVIPAAKYMNKIQISDQQLQAYYQQHKTEFKSPEEVSVDYLELSTKTMPKKLTKQELQKQFADKSDRLADLTYTNSDNLGVASKALGLAIKSTALFSRKGGDNPLTKNPKIIAAAFSDDVLKQGYNSNSIQIDDNTIVVLRIKQHKPAGLRAFAEVKDKIKTRLSSQLAAQETAKVGNALIAKLSANQDQKALMAQGLKWHVEKNIGRISDNLNSDILLHAFQIRTAQAPLDGFNLANGDFVIVKLNAIQAGVLANDSKETRQAYALEIQRSLGQLAYGLYVEGLMNNSKIKREKLTLDVA